jgi:hypothetical protein
VKVVIDESRYDSLQMEVGSAITHEIYTVMKRAGVADSERLEKVVADALFHIGCILDRSHTIDSPDGTMQAVLTFANEEDQGALISAGGGSRIHEYAFGIAEEYFDGLKPERKASVPPLPQEHEQRMKPQDDQPPLTLSGRIVRWFTN